MTSEAEGAFVWIWLPGQIDPVVCGQLIVIGERVQFQYGRSYLDRDDCIAVYDPELPLGDGLIAPSAGDHPLCIADAGPDSWGQRVILNTRYGAGAKAASADLGLVDYLLASASNRIGALDFQASSRVYVPRSKGESTLEELARASEYVDKKLPLTPDLAEALLRGSSIGGARPKATLVDGSRQLIAKFASSTDPYPVVQSEFAAMRLASLASMDVAPVEIIESLDRHVLLVERFDRPPDGTRKAVVSALTILGLSERDSMGASYATLADQIRGRFTAPDETLRELFSRVVFSILISNTDDHARNTAAFWDGRDLTLTPAYDLCPQRRAGGEAKQIMQIGHDGWRYSRLAGCVERAATYHLTETQAREIIDHQIDTLVHHWADVCDEARLSQQQRDDLWGTQFCNPYAFHDYRATPPFPAAGTSGKPTPAPAPEEPDAGPHAGENRHLRILRAIVAREAELVADGRAAEFMLLQMPGPSWGLKPGIPNEAELAPRGADLLELIDAGYLHDLGPSTSTGVLLKFAVTSQGRQAGAGGSVTSQPGSPPKAPPSADDLLLWVADLAATSEGSQTLQASGGFMNDALARFGPGHHALLATHLFDLKDEGLIAFDDPLASIDQVGLTDRLARAERLRLTSAGRDRISQLRRPSSR